MEYGCQNEIILTLFLINFKYMNLYTILINDFQCNILEDENDY
jgi:hypothetical protein